MRLVPPYSAYAGIYDDIGQRAFGERMAAVILQELMARGKTPHSVLDLGCGTGSATVAFARAGLVATGIDRAPQMLDRARENAAAAQVAATFTAGDMTELDHSIRFELVTCIYDAVNYLEDDDALRQLFREVFRSLEPGGSFAFDMNTRHRLNSSWEQGLMLAGDSDDLFVTYRSWFDSALDASPLIITAFVRESESCWRRFDEEHVERAWPIEHVVAWLEQTGFRVDQVSGYIDSTGDLVRPAREDHGRVLFLASR